MLHVLVKSLQFIWRSSAVFTYGCPIITSVESDLMVLHSSSTYGLESDMPYWVHPMISPILLLYSLPGTHAECLECSSSIPACPTTPQYSWACRRDGGWWTWTDHKPVEERNWLSERCETIKSNNWKWMFVNNEPLPLHCSFTLSHRYLLCRYAPVYWDKRLQ